MRFGAGAGERGVVFVLTLGTGLGSGMFNDGVLVPNTELGHMEIRGRDAERRSAAVARTRRGLSWKAWASDLDEHLHAIDKLFSPNLIILGGGVSKNADKFIPRLPVRRGRPGDAPQRCRDRRRGDGRGRAIRGGLGLRNGEAGVDHQMRHAQRINPTSCGGSADGECLGINGRADIEAKEPAPPMVRMTTS